MKEDLGYLLTETSLTKQISHRTEFEPQVRNFQVLRTQNYRLITLTAYRLREDLCGLPSPYNEFLFVFNVYIIQCYF